MIQPTATNTPFPQHAKNETTLEPKLPDPLDDPRDVAEAILTAATTPTRSIKVGAMSKVNTTIAKVLPKLGDKMAARMADKQHYVEKPRNPEGILNRASEFVSGAGNVQGNTKFMNVIEFALKLPRIRRQETGTRPCPACHENASLQASCN